MSEVAPGKRRGWRVAMVLGLLVVVGCGTGLWAAWSRLFAAPLAPGLRAYKQGDWAAATTIAQAVLQTHANDRAALRLLARSSIHLGRDDIAIALYTRRLDNSSFEAEDYLLMGLAVQRRGEDEKALQVWGKALETDPLPAPILDDLMQVFLDSRDRQYDAANQADVAHRERASGKPLPPSPLDQAIRAAERLRREPGRETRADMVLGISRVTLNDLPGAALAFRGALRRDPQVVDKTAEPIKLRKMIARTFLRVGSPAEARTQLEVLADRGPDPETFWLLSRAALQQGAKADVQAALARAGPYRSENPLEDEPALYVGEVRCGQCHRTIFKQSLAHRHTQSFYRGPDLQTLPRPDRPWPDPDNPKVSHSIRQAGSELWEETRVGNEVIRSLVEYAFGTKDRYLTMVNRDPQNYYHIVRMSYYCAPEGKGWDRSLLDVMTPTRAEEYSGQSIGIGGGVVKCLHCHVTFPRAGRDRVGPETADRAIGCERCHGPGSHHIAAVEASLQDLAIVNPATASPRLVTEKKCNVCHVLDQSYTRDDRDNPGWVRSQGVGWLWSRCNTESGGAFGCVTCHNPHQTAREMTTAQYESKCLGCHSAPTVSSHAGIGPPAHAPAVVKSSVCPVSPVKGCIGCHMPRVREGSAHLDVTDHYIRIRREMRVQERNDR